MATVLGAVNFQLDRGLLLTLEVFYVPDFGVSLISVDYLNQSEYEILFRPGQGLLRSVSIGRQSESDELARVYALYSAAS
jgi:hypothetical protein